VYLGSTTSSPSSVCSKRDLNCTPFGREAISWVATTAGISGEMIRDMMARCVEQRFGTLHAPYPVQSSIQLSMRASTAAAFGIGLTRT
jgi:hypothetical protein